MSHRICLIGVSTVLAALLAVLASGASATQKSADDDEDEAKILGRRAFLENCRICHGEEMTTRQRLTTKQWTAEVEKMVNWGAPVPVDQKSNLLNYLATTFSDKAPPPPVVAVGIGELLVDNELLLKRPLPVGDPTKGAALYAQHCASCHGNAGQGADLGPRLVERPVLLDPASYHDALRHGRNRMPGFSAVLREGEADQILAWLRTQR
jgi:mono/diheme cytochrome c family protein